MAASRWIVLVFLVSFNYLNGLSKASEDVELGSLRVVFQTRYGDIEFGFLKHIAPKTVTHITKLVKLGAYNTNHFFRVDKGFVAQVADVIGGRDAPLNDEQREEGQKTVVGEFSDVKHTRGILSMGRYDDPDSASSSFSILLGDAPHLDTKYAVFGKVTKGYETLSRLEELPTKRDGIFVMPLERITILSTYFYDLEEKISSEAACEQEVAMLRQRILDSNERKQGTLLGLFLGVPLGCVIISSIAWKRQWWQGMPKPKLSSSDAENSSCKLSSSKRKRHTEMVDLFHQAAENHILRERMRREDMSNKFAKLESLLPMKSKRDRTAVVNDAIQFVLEMQEKRKQLLQQQILMKSKLRKLKSPDMKPAQSSITSSTLEKTCNTNINKQTNCFSSSNQLIQLERSKPTPASSHNSLLLFHNQHLCNFATPARSDNILSLCNICRLIDIRVTLPTDEVKSGSQEVMIQISCPSILLASLPKFLVTVIGTCINHLQLHLLHLNYCRSAAETHCIIIAKVQPNMNYPNHKNVMNHIIWTLKCALLGYKT